MPWLPKLSPVYPEAVIPEQRSPLPIWLICCQTGSKDLWHCPTQPERERSEYRLLNASVKTKPGTGEQLRDPKMITEAPLNSKACVFSEELMHHFQSSRDDMWEGENRFLLGITSVAIAFWFWLFLFFLRPIWDFGQCSRSFKSFY